ncbi:ribbon-helix-helix protein, CopG family [Halomarina halobia]|uniref:Ribbon-helix-helix protein, CopG family n=1 Tax=Halomarina halobia TaxID=3033386 RepID=A0ABD6AEV2_9EURY|nr:ribbon-helix-helix protein, CopG family [Halomarina sp. PSR21]
MVSDRLTVSLDKDSREALDDLVSQTGQGQSELVRQALLFYAANFQAANTATSTNLQQYHKMLSSGEHVLLDIDFLHGLLDYVEVSAGEPDPEFAKVIDRVAEYHAEEYRSRFSTLSELLDWLSVCGFLKVRQADTNTYHVVFPTEKIKWFMTKFIQQSTAKLPFEIEIAQGVSKVIVTEHRTR